MSEALFDLTARKSQADPQWRLAEVQVANWGTFHDAIYHIPVARKGHLITGPSGSGKSSLLDAIAAVLTPDKWLRLNQAAQGGRRRDDQRSVYSYVRGAWSRTVDATEDKVVSAYLRDRATWSGIVLRFEDGLGGTASLARLFFLRATASTSAEINDLCLLERSAVDLEELQDFVAAGIETRKIAQRWPTAVVTSNHSHSKFYARMRSVFGIAEETALQLLHKTQAAKSLDSLDQLFRDYMLPTPGTFALADTAVEQFGELRDAHDRVVQLRRQRDDLLALREHAERYDAAQDAADRTRTLIDAVRPYRLRRTLDLARTDLADLEERLRVLTIEVEQADTAHAAARTAYEDAERRVHSLGGAEVDRLQERIRLARDTAGAVRARWQEFDTSLRSVGVDGAPEDADGFAELVRAIDEILAQEPPPGMNHEQMRALAEARAEVQRLDREVASIRTTGSTVPDDLLTIRAELALDLAVPVAALPFAAEQLEVRADHADWTGAIERVLRPFALTLLVRSEHLPAVRRWIDTRSLRARLVFEEVSASAPPARPARSELSLVHRVTVAPGPFSTWIAGQLSERYDYACVDSPDSLGEHVRAVTINGQLKTSRTRYEKDDRRRIDDRGRWVLGDRDGKLEALSVQRREAATRRNELEEAANRSDRDRTAAVSRQAVLRTLRRQSWGDIDRRGAAAAVAALEQQLVEVSANRGDLHAALTDQHQAQQQMDAATAQRDELRFQLRSANDSRAAVATVVAEIEGDVASGAVAEIDARTTAALDERFRRHGGRRITRERIGDISQDVTQQLGQENTAALSAVASAGNAVVGAATHFNDHWPAAAATAELVATVGDRGAYLDLLDSIVAQGLPDHEANFLRLLRDRSRDLIGELVSDIHDAPREIEERIRPVNASLRRSPFDVGRFLKLRIKTRRTETVHRFLADLRSVADGSWTDDDIASAERRFAILADLMRRLASSDHVDRTWRLQCLDTRLHVTFLAEEIDDLGRVQATYDSGAAMSGGQQQKLVIFCLAAALRYQLADTDDAVPRYGTIVLDEAFDKADTRYTRMALDVFVEFGFQMVLATPQKLLQTIEPYVGGATSIENPTRRLSTFADIPWNERREEKT